MGYFPDTTLSVLGLRFRGKMRDAFGKIIYESVAEIAHPKHTALLPVDVTNDFCHGLRQ